MPDISRAVFFKAKFVKNEIKEIFTIITKQQQMLPVNPKSFLLLIFEIGIKPFQCCYKSTKYQVLLKYCEICFLTFKYTYKATFLKRKMCKQ